MECTNSQFIYYIRPVVSDMSKQSQDATTLCNVGEKRERALQLAAFQQHLELVVTDVMETCQRLRFEQKRMNPHPLSSPSPAIIFRCYSTVSTRPVIVVIIAVLYIQLTLVERKLFICTNSICNQAKNRN